MMQQHIILALLWIIFCSLHSLLASLKIKKRIQIKSGRYFKFYRIGYTLFAFLTLIGVFVYQFNIVSPFLYKPVLFTYGVGGLLSLVGLTVMLICIKKYFISLSGLQSLFMEKPSNTLMISGIHRFVRHPLYSGTFLFIWGLFILMPYLSLLIADVVITAYTLLGITLEEEKLETEFGDRYKHYKQQVPKLIPSFKRYKA